MRLAKPCRLLPVLVAFAVFAGQPQEVVTAKVAVRPIQGDTSSLRASCSPHDTASRETVHTEAGLAVEKAPQHFKKIGSSIWK